MGDRVVALAGMLPATVLFVYIGSSLTAAVRLGGDARTPHGGSADERDISAMARFWLWLSESRGFSYIIYQKDGAVSSRPLS